MTGIISIWYTLFIFFMVRLQWIHTVLTSLNTEKFHVPHAHLRAVRISSVHFQTGCHMSRLNLSVVFCLFCVIISFVCQCRLLCFCAVRYSFFSTMLSDWFRAYLKRPFFVSNDTVRLIQLFNNIYSVVIRCISLCIIISITIPHEGAMA